MLLLIYELTSMLKKIDDSNTSHVIVNLTVPINHPAYEWNSNTSHVIVNQLT